jgi:predicted site-specific integrase-resolvase
VIECLFLSVEYILKNEENVYEYVKAGTVNRFIIKRYSSICYLTLYKVIKIEFFYMLYANTKEARELLRVTATTLRRWDKEGKIQVIRTPSGIRMYNKACISRILGEKGIDIKRKKIAYCRVSSKKQIDDLERQKDSIRSSHPDHELVQDIGSGINFKRKGLQSILEQAMRGELEEVVVSHRDRLCRFAFELIEWIFTKNNTKLVVLDKTEHKSGSKELTIIQVFACREMGKRRYKNAKDKAATDTKAKTSIGEVG